MALSCPGCKWCSDDATEPKRRRVWGAGVSDGRTVWWPKDTGWWRREYVVELGEEFGASGPAVLDWLSCEAKLQNDGGRVKSGIKSVARGCFVDVVTVGHALSRLSQLGALDDFKEDRGRFTCRISGWKADNSRALAAARKQEERARKAAENGLVEPKSAAVTQRDMSRSVTLRHAPSRSSQNVTLREEKRREELLPPPTPPKGERQRELNEWEQKWQIWAAREFPGLSEKAVIGFARSAMTALRSPATNLADVRSAVLRGTGG